MTEEVKVQRFSILGQKVAGAIDFLETFPRPEGVDQVVMTSDEVTGLCPITGQPDFYTVEVMYVPDADCIESKSLKLYLQQFRNDPMFGEAMSAKIMGDVVKYIDPMSVIVTVTQKPRGGITIKSRSSYFK